MAATFRTTTDIDAPPEVVWRHLCDLDRWPEWMNGLVAVERTDQGELGVGSGWVETRRMFGREASETFEITRFEPPTALDLYVDGSKGASGKGRYDFEYRLVPREGGTRMEVDASIDMPGWFAQLMSRLMLRGFRRAIEKDHRAFQQHVEAHAG